MTALRLLSMLHVVGVPCTGSESMAHLPAEGGGGVVLASSVLWGGGYRVPSAASLHSHPALFPFASYVFSFDYQGGNWVSSRGSWVCWVLPWDSEKTALQAVSTVPGFPFPYSDQMPKSMERHLGNHKEWPPFIIDALKSSGNGKFWSFC